MKRTIYLIALIALLSCSDSKSPERGADGKILKNGQFYDSQEAETGTVWICTGKSSHAYHSTDECYGIKACKGKVKKVLLEDARNMGRTPCHYCHKESKEIEEEDLFDPDIYDPMNDEEEEQDD